MGKLTDREERDLVIDAVLVNWGRWVRGNPLKHLEYPSKCPSCRDYISPWGSEKTSVRVPVFEDEGMDANDAVNLVAAEFGKNSRQYLALILRYRDRFKPYEIAEQFKCSKRSVYNYLNSAKHFFWGEYQSIIREKHPNAE